jgi:hypothetical protein
MFAKICLPHVGLIGSWEGRIAANDQQAGVIEFGVDQRPTHWSCASAKCACHSTTTSRFTASTESGWMAGVMLNAEVCHYTLTAKAGSDFTSSEKESPCADLTVFPGKL